LSLIGRFLRFPPPAAPNGLPILGLSLDECLCIFTFAEKTAMGNFKNFLLPKHYLANYKPNVDSKREEMEEIAVKPHPLEAKYTHPPSSKRSFFSKLKGNTPSKSTTNTAAPRTFSVKKLANLSPANLFSLGNDSDVSFYPSAERLSTVHNMRPTTPAPTAPTAHVVPDPYAAHLNNPRPLDYSTTHLRLPQKVADNIRVQPKSQKNALPNTQARPVPVTTNTVPSHTVPSHAVEITPGSPPPIQPSSAEILEAAPSKPPRPSVPYTKPKQQPEMTLAQARMVVNMTSLDPNGISNMAPDPKTNHDHAGLLRRGAVAASAADHHVSHLKNRQLRQHLNNSQTIPSDVIQTKLTTLTPQQEMSLQREQNAERMPRHTPLKMDDPADDNASIKGIHTDWRDAGVITPSKLERKKREEATPKKLGLRPVRENPPPVPALGLAAFHGAVPEQKAPYDRLAAFSGTSSGTKKPETKKPKNPSLRDTFNGAVPEQKAPHSRSAEFFGNAPVPEKFKNK
jgi:hypothetical protein